jgi:hypothetical protein
VAILFVRQFDGFQQGPRNATSGARARTALGYNRSGLRSKITVRKASEPAIPPSAMRVFEEIDPTEEVLKSGTCGDRLAAEAQNQRARAQYGVELIKAVRSNPFNILNGLRYQVR